jgi:hypothetical protein
VESGAEKMKPIIRIALIFVLMTILFLSYSAYSEDIISSSQELEWQQADTAQSFSAGVEKEVYSTLDPEGRFFFAFQAGKEKIDAVNLKSTWKINDKLAEIASGVTSLKKGMAYVNFLAGKLKPGEYNIDYEIKDTAKTYSKGTLKFFIEPAASPQLKGKIQIVFPAGLDIPQDLTWPVSFGIPFPKGVLFNKDSLTLKDGSGKSIPCQTIIRSKWGYGDKSSIRWLGVDFMAEKSPSWWPDMKASKYFIQYGSDQKISEPALKISIKNTDTTFLINTGAAEFSVNKKTFNLIGGVKTGNEQVISDSGKEGLYLIDNEGAVYRAANDANVKVSIEEQGPIRTTLKAEGWYVKDGSAGKMLSYKLPTEKLCKFVCRIEFYAGKEYVRILNSTVFTFDSFSVRLKDLGISIPLQNAGRASFGIEDKKAADFDIPKNGIYLIQHLADKFEIEDGGGKNLMSGTHASGFFSISSGEKSVSCSLRDTWQKFPKEFEAVDNRMKIHVWPSHGRYLKEIDETAHENIHRALFAHQGKEMNLAVPWEYYIATAKIYDSDASGVYTPVGLALAGVHSSAMGISVTSDMLLDFRNSKSTGKITSENLSKVFIKTLFAMAAPEWNSKSLAAGWIHQYDRDNFKVYEEIIENCMDGYWKTNRSSGEYGMWIYSRWHHNEYLGEGKWNLYRLNGGTHHYEAIMPWLFLYRSGNPFYQMQGMAHGRLLTDLLITHYDDPSYPHKEFHSTQKRLLGSTKHTNGFVPWGGDHAIGSHQTCYNGVLLSYYMTGDLRFKDIIDEVENTIVNDRLNPNYKPADRSVVPDGTLVTGVGSARDIGNYVGELIDLYQYNYDPKLLAVLSPRLDQMINRCGRNWGFPYQNILMFNGSKVFSKNLLDSADKTINNAEKAEDIEGTNNCFFYKYNATPYLTYTMAAILDPDSKNNYHAYANLNADPLQMLSWSKTINDPETNRTPLCLVPDNVLFLPNLMYASAGKPLSVAPSVPFPVAPEGNICIIKEDKDQEIEVNFNCKSEIDFIVRIFDTENKEIHNVKIPAGAYYPYSIKIPKDGKKGQYALVINGFVENKGRINAPLTSLPEIYYIPKSWSQFSPGRYFCKLASGKSGNLIVGGHKAAGIITDSFGQNVLASSKSGEGMKVTVDEKGIIIKSQARYVGVSEPIILSATIDNWFQPDSSKLDFKK